MKDKCDKDCRSCDISQRTYCAAQMAIKNQDMINEILAIIKNKEENLIPMQAESEVVNENNIS